MNAADSAKTIRIGLTGPIGCGKSTVAGWLRDFGAVVVDADVIARDVVEPGTPDLTAVIEAFGPGVVAEDGSLDRAALGRIVFVDPDALARLEAIVHPAVRPRILAGIAAAERDGAPAVVIEAVKLVEGGLAELCDEVWLVVCDPGEQRRRLGGRGLTAAEADRRIAAQADPGARLAGSATLVIDTTGDQAAAWDRVRAAWREVLLRRG
jgi:dephospho-CoA kinase